MPTAIKEEVFAAVAASSVVALPDVCPTELHEKLAAFANWRADGVIAGNGSNELIQSAAHRDGGRRLRASSSPSRLSRSTANWQPCSAAKSSRCRSTKNLTFNIPKLASKLVSTKADLTIICSPNNPTGCTIERRDLAALLRNTEGLVVVDQAYVEFGGENHIPLLKEHPNLIVLRTFSKAMAMAGLRVGYLLASPSLVTEINKAKLPYNLNFFSMMAAEVAS